MAFYQFKRQQLVETQLEPLWEFISSPKNLGRITPEYMKFAITSSEHVESMYKGMIISYRINLLPLIKVTWVTEISHIEPYRFFIDTQLIGPYKLWHHQHLLEPKKNGVLMTDIVSYSPPFGLLGGFANHLYINKQLEKIFAYRERKINQIFAKKLP